MTKVYTQSSAVSPFFHTKDGFVDPTVYSSTGELCADVMLWPVSLPHRSPSGIVGVGVAENSHLLQENSYFSSREGKGETDSKEGVKDGGRQQ